MESLPVGRMPTKGNHTGQPAWKAELADAITDPAELARLLELDLGRLGLTPEMCAGFPLRITHSYLRRIRRGDPADPLLRQILPTAKELLSSIGFSTDAVGDGAAQLAPGLLHKYHGRLLILTSAGCGVHCRFCFRRHYPYGQIRQHATLWRQAAAAALADATVHEIILSGGDPLVLDEEELSRLSAELDAVPHLRRLRVHTRLPIVLPSRICQSLLDWLGSTRLAPRVVVHCNHPREISDEVAVALQRLVQAGIPVLNQSVLLAGVNDSIEVLTELCEQLVDLGVLPYYLHQLDRVAGAAHFEVPIEQGRAIVASLRQRLPGYAVPRYVQEHSGAANKTPID